MAANFRWYQLLACVPLRSYITTDQSNRRVSILHRHWYLAMPRSLPVAGMLQRIEARQSLLSHRTRKSVTMTPSCCIYPVHVVMLLLKQQWHFSIALGELAACIYIYGSTVQIYWEVCCIIKCYFWTAASSTCLTCIQHLFLVCFYWTDQMNDTWMTFLWLLLVRLFPAHHSIDEECLF